QVFRNPSHPYTRGLLDCLPRLGRQKHATPLRPIGGYPPSPLLRPEGCAFAPRCAHAEPGRCTAAPIPSLAVAGEPAHCVRCVRLGELPPSQASAQPAAAAATTATAEILLETQALAKRYRQRRAFGGGGPAVQALDAVDLKVERGETLAIVGESGCGKSTFARVLSGLETATGGRVLLEGQEIGRTPAEARPRPLKRKLQMVFQNPDSTLNPSHRVGYAIARAVRRLKGKSAADAWAEAERLLEVVQLPPEFATRRPSQLSGGQKQRVAIARAIAGDPEVVVADEPVSSLDVSVQAAIINLLSDLQAERGETLVFISHDLAVVRYLADHVAVMYLGQVVEFGPVDAVFEPPW